MTPFVLGFQCRCTRFDTDVRYYRSAWFAVSFEARVRHLTSAIGWLNGRFQLRGGGGRMMNILLWSVTSLLVVTAVYAEPIASNDIYVLDGNTLDKHGQRIRLVGFDAPEEGQRARCATERTLAARASARLRQIIRRGDRIDLQMVACACPPGTEGTQQCNSGWPCGRLTVDGKDVGDILVAENLAHAFVCGQYSCPKRMSWCAFETPE
jgi:endonuclease YncB( thermonuclease family)